MYKSLLILLLALSFNLNSYCQIKETVDKDITLIHYVPYGQLGLDDPQKEERANKKFRRTNHEYHEILSLDTMAIPCLISKINDTTQTGIRVPCAVRYLKTGDVAFALLNDIILIPWYTVTGKQWNSYNCDSLPDGGWVYLDANRSRFQKELRSFFASSKGKVWLRIFKDKSLNKNDRAELIKRFQNMPNVSYSEDSSFGSL